MAALSVAALAGGLLASASVAAEGPAPASTTRTVIGDVHTDSISTFWDAGHLELASKADVPELATRYDSDQVWFHVDNDSRFASWPAGAPAFVAPTGSTVWLAPQTQATNQIWPGFSTEAISAGLLTNNDITFTLQGVDGPGAVEVWTTGSFGAVTRLWSSDEAFKSFTRKNNVHMHANWAFTEPGVYELTVKADAVVAATSEPTTDTQVYTFVVGDMPETILTNTALEASDTSLVAGDPVTLTAAVSPGAIEDFAGAVEFRDGATVLGHDPVDEDGSAELIVPDLAVGSHEITATFVPETTNIASASTSAPQTVTVDDGSGAPFAVTGVAESYAPGATLAAQVTGVTVGENQTLRWLIRPVGTTGAGTTLQTSPSTAYTTPLSIADDDYEISVALRTLSPAAVLSQTPWVPIQVSSDVEPQTLTRSSADTVHFGDAWTATIGGRALIEGETSRIVSRSLTSGRWAAATGVTIDGNAVVRQQVSGSLLWALQVVRDGVAVAQSAPIEMRSVQREVQFSGLKGVYRLGQTLQATATAYPPKEGLIFEWRIGNTIVKTETSAEHSVLEYTPTLADHNKSLSLILYYIHPGASTRTTVGLTSSTLKVSDTPPDTQLFFFGNLSGHYHQGNAVNLRLTADPELAADDQVIWEWKWPGEGNDWTSFPGAEGLSRTLTAEQALDEVQIRATLDPAAAGKESLIAAPVTIHHDDHGSPARQQPTVGGHTDYTAGESLALTRELPENGPTVLTEHQWERKAAGSDEWVPIEGQSGAELQLPATLADDGASYRISILKPGGGVAYGPSAGVTISVEPETATELAIAGVQESYAPGDVLRARTVGRALEEGQTWRWIIRPVGATSSGYVFYGDGAESEVGQGRLRQLLGADHDGYEIRARLRQGNSYANPAVDTPWVPLHVEATVEPITTTFPAGNFYVGDTVDLPLSRPLAAGESVRLVSRYSSPWSEMEGVSVQGQTLRLRSPYGIAADTELALQTVRDGVVVAMSAPFTGQVADREVLVAGMRAVYRVGQTMSLTAEVHPAKEGLVYQWLTFEYDPETFEFSLPVIKEGTGPDALSLDLPMTMDWNEKPILFFALDSTSGEELIAGGWSGSITVSDAPPGEQLLFLENLSGHYHQGNTINLNLVADPELGAGDTVAWQWKWPGEGNDWITLPGASGSSHQLTAEQALNNVEVRATVDFAAEGKESKTSVPVTIHHDDHGSPARQVPTIGGDTSVVEGDTVALHRELPPNGPTVLTQHRWEKKVGEGDWTTVEGQSGATLSFAAALADDEAEYRVSILKPDGTVAYGPSATVALDVTAMPELVSGATPQISGEPIVGMTLTATAGGWTPEPDQVTYQWLADEEVIEGETGSQLVLSQALIGKQINVLVTASKQGYLGGNNISDAVGPVEPDPVVTTVSAAPITQVYGQQGRLVIDVSPMATGMVEVKVGSATLYPVLNNGRATAVLPRKSLTPGRRTVSIKYLGVAGQYSASEGSAVVSVLRAAPRVKVTPLTRVVKRGGLASIEVQVSAFNVTPSGQVVVRLLGRERVVRLDGQGRAVVSVRIPATARPGMKTATVVYRGDDYVGRDPSTVSRLRVTR